VLRKYLVDQLGPIGQRRADDPPDAPPQVCRPLGHFEERRPDLVRLRAGEGRAIALGSPRLPRGLERVERRPERRRGGGLGQPAHDVGGRQAAMDLGLGGDRLIGVPPQRRGAPGGEERVHQGPALRLVGVEGGPQSLGRGHPGVEQRGSARPGLGSELLEPERGRAGCPPLRLTAVDEVRRAPEPPGLHDVTEGLGGRAEPRAEPLQAPEEAPRGAG